MSSLGHSGTQRRGMVCSGGTLHKSSFSNPQSRPLHILSQRASSKMRRRVRGPSPGSGPDPGVWALSPHASRLKTHLGREQNHFPGPFGPPAPICVCGGGGGRACAQGTWPAWHVLMCSAAHVRGAMMHIARTACATPVPTHMPHISTATRPPSLAYHVSDIRESHGRARLVQAPSQGPSWGEGGLQWRFLWGTHTFRTLGRSNDDHTFRRTHGHPPHKPSTAIPPLLQSAEQQNHPR